jgi:hypothetical protein
MATHGRAAGTHVRSQRLMRIGPVPPSCRRARQVSHRHYFAGPYIAQPHPRHLYVPTSSLPPPCCLLMSAICSGSSDLFPLSRRHTLVPASIVVSRAEQWTTSNHIARKMRKIGIASRVDDSSASIGKKYARNDELGTPFGCTVDFASIKKGTMTLRYVCQLFTMALGSARSMCGGSSRSEGGITHR